MQPQQILGKAKVKSEANAHDSPKYPEIRGCLFGPNKRSEEKDGHRLRRWRRLEVPVPAADHPREQQLPAVPHRV